MNRLFTLIIVALFVFAVQPTIAKTTIVHGSDSTYAEQTLRLYTWDDGWGYTQTILDSCTVQTDGTFRFEFQLNETRKAFLQLGKYEGCLFIEPGKTYHINLPAYSPISSSDLLNPYYQPQELLVSFNNLPATDLNVKIATFEDAFDAQWNKLISRQPISPQDIEQAMSAIDSICPPDSNSFLQEYRHFRYALMVNLHASTAPDLSIKTYFLHQPVLYHQPAYWEAFEAIFPHFDQLTGLYSNLPLFELAMMQKVESGDLPANKLKYIQTPQNKLIAQSIQEKKSTLAVGHTIQLDQIVNIHGDTIRWKELSFPKAYIIFANSKLRESLSDIDYVRKMSRKYKDKCLFLLIFTDDDIKSVQQACIPLSNHDFIATTIQNPQLIKIFNQMHAPAYFVLDTNSKLAQVPAPEPKNFIP